MLEPVANRTLIRVLSSSKHLSRGAERYSLDECQQIGVDRDDEGLKKSIVFIITTSGR